MLRLAIAYDGSPGAAAALAAAAELFAPASAVVVTAPRSAASALIAGAGLSPAIDPDTYRELDAELEAAAREVAEAGAEQARAAGLDATAATTDGLPPVWRGLLDAARDADVLVCGSRGQGGLKRAVLGSTSTSLLHHAELPLLIVDEHAATADGPSLIAYDGSQNAARAIAVAARVLPNRPAFIAHAWESPYVGAFAGRPLTDPAGGIPDMAMALEHRLRDRAEAVLNEAIAAAQDAGLTATGATFESTDGAWRALARAAEEHNAAVIVTGSRGLGGVRSALLGSVSAGLVHNAGRPVLVVPPGE